MVKLTKKVYVGTLIAIILLVLVAVAVKFVCNGSTLEIINSCTTGLFATVSSWAGQLAGLLIIVFILETVVLVIRKLTKKVVFE